MAQFRVARLPIDQLLFDLDNYRFRDESGYVATEQHRVAEEPIQDGVYAKLKADPTLEQLRISIERNTFLPLEPLAVRPCPSREGSFVVIEGNRRLAAARWILEKATRGGVDLPEKVLASVRELPVVVIEGEDSGDIVETVSALMGIRHVSGIKAWGGYQSALLIVAMRDLLHLETRDVAERLAMTSRAVNRRYKAFKALEQMRQDEEFGDRADPAMYALFHEAVDASAVRRWLGWDERYLVFREAPELRRFYDLICPRTEGEQRLDAKITSYTQIRSLGEILDNPDARRCLLDSPGLTWHDAMARAKRDDVDRDWIDRIRAATTVLEGLPISRLKAMTIEEEDHIQRLGRVVAERLEDLRRVRGGVASE